MKIIPKTKYPYIIIQKMKIGEYMYGAVSILIKHKDSLNETLVLGYDIDGRYLHNISSVNDDLANWVWRKML